MPILYSFKFKNIFYTGQTCCLTQVILKTLDKGALQAYLCSLVRACRETGFNYL